MSPRALPGDAGGGRWGTGTSPLAGGGVAHSPLGLRPFRGARRPRQLARRGLPHV